MRRIAVVLCSAALTLLIAALARAPFRPPHSDVAVLRFSWRMSVTAKENCRARTHEELEDLPVHMRTPVACTRDAASYALLIRVAGLPTDTVHLVRGGVKGDRPLFVLEQRVLPPGNYRVRAQLQRSVHSETKKLAALDTMLAMEPGTVRLITLDASNRRLIAR